jgi:rRNA small subunit pseudouridine methyltransferase Nep1
MLNIHLLLLGSYVCILDAYTELDWQQCLLTLLDSPLNKAGLLQVYIHTAKGVLIEVNPGVRIPRTFKRFSGLMGKSPSLFPPSCPPAEYPLQIQFNSSINSLSGALMVQKSFYKSLRSVPSRSQCSWPDLASCCIEPNHRPPPTQHRQTEYVSHPRVFRALTSPLALSADVPTVRLSEYLPKLPETHSVAVFVGAMARG